LTREFTIVATDLRGYGDSSKPDGGPDHAGYSKRAMAQDQVEVMSELGFETFFVAGHDRGGRVAHRMALDHPGRVKKLAVLDIVRRLECPLLALWGEHAPMHRLYDVAATWRERATNVTGRSLPGTHYFAEEIPELVAAELGGFFR